MNNWWRWALLVMLASIGASMREFGGAAWIQILACVFGMIGWFAGPEKPR